MSVFSIAFSTIVFLFPFSFWSFYCLPPSSDFPFGISILCVQQTLRNDNISNVIYVYKYCIVFVYRYHNILICLFRVLIIRIMHQSHNGQGKDQSNNLSDNNRIKMYGLKNMCHLQSNNYVICPFHLENLMSVKSPLGLVLYCYLNMPTINKTYLILSYLILSYVIGQKVDT
jgi:hypothetical protein